MPGVGLGREPASSEESFVHFEDFLGQMIFYLRVHQKLAAKIYQDIHDRWTVQTTASRRIELLKQCYVLRHSASSEDYYLLDEQVLARLMPRIVQLPDRRIPQRALIDPEQEFVPSSRLANLVKANMTVPDKEDVHALLRDLKLLEVHDEERTENVRKLITMQVEGMLTNLAKRAERTGEKAQIATGTRFTPEVCEEVIVRLGLDTLTARPVLDLLHTELLRFISAGTRRREWGTIFASDGEIGFQIGESAFARPDYLNIMNDDKWEIA